MARHGDGILRGPALSKPIVRRTGGWLLTVLGILWGVYGAIHLLLGVARAIHGPERTVDAFGDPEFVGAKGWSRRPIQFQRLHLLKPSKYRSTVFLFSVTCRSTVGLPMCSDEHPT
jgi:hypothetical protein